MYPIRCSASVNKLKISPNNVRRSFLQLLLSKYGLNSVPFLSLQSANAFNSSCSEKVKNSIALNCFILQHNHPLTPAFVSSAGAGNYLFDLLKPFHHFMNQFLLLYFLALTSTNSLSPSPIRSLGAFHSLPLFRHPESTNTVAHALARKAHGATHGDRMHGCGRYLTSYATEARTHIRPKALQSTYEHPSATLPYLLAAFKFAVSSVG